MGYGIQCLNADGRVQVDSSELTPNTYLKSISAQAYTAMTYPPTGYVSGDLVIARPANNSPLQGSTDGGAQFMSRERSTGKFRGHSGTASYLYNNTAGIVSGLVRSQYGNIAAPAAVEYGLDVYHESDQSNVIFSATRSTSVTVLAQGVLTQGSSTTYTPPTTLSWDKIYAVMNGTEFFYSAGGSVIPSFAASQGYSFYPNATSPYIRMSAGTSLNGQSISAMVGGAFGWMIIHDPN